MSDSKPIFVALGLPDISAVMVLRGSVSTMDGGQIPSRVSEIAQKYSGKTDWDLAVSIAKELCGVVTHEKKVVYGLLDMTNN